MESGSTANGTSLSSPYVVDQRVLMKDLSSALGPLLKEEKLVLFSLAFCVLAWYYSFTISK